MFLNTLMASNLFPFVMDEIDVASLQRNKLYAFVFARILGPYIDKRVCDAKSRVIQKFWRQCGRFMTTTKLSKRFIIKARMTDAEMRSMSFDEIIPFLKEPGTVHVTKCFMKRALTISSSLSSIRVDMEARNFRIFLASCLAVFFTRKVFQHMHEREQNVFNTGAPLLACVFDVSARLAEGARFIDLPQELVASLPTLMNAYDAAFAVWKPADEMVLSKRIIDAWACLLHARRQALPVFELFGRIDFEIGRMRVKYGQINGQKALDVADRYMALMEEIEDVKDNMSGFLI